MTYKAVFLNTFLKQFKKLPRNLQQRVRKRILELVKNPYVGRGLRGERKDRVGDCQIIYKVDERAKTAIFYDVDLRKRVYG